MTTPTQVSATNSAATSYRKRLPRAFLTHLYPLPYFDTHTEGLFWFLVFLALYIPSVLRSRLDIRPEGIELFYWPAERFSVSWKEVLEVRRKRLLGLLDYDMLILDRPFPSFRSPMIGAGEARRRQAGRMFVPLSDFAGWPDGALAADLRRHAPRLFSDGTDDTGPGNRMPIDKNRIESPVREST